MERPYILQEACGTAPRMSIALVTETYPPEINGVARTIGLMVEHLCAQRHHVQLIRPRQGASDVPKSARDLREVLKAGVPIPRYANLRLGLPAKSALVREWTQNRPDIVHVVTEGPLGWSALAAARQLRLPVSSDFHTNFHAYSRHYGFGWFNKAVAAYLRRLHNRADCTMVPTEEMRAQLAHMGFERLVVVGRGVDTALFDPVRRDDALRASWGCGGRDDVVVLYCGRLAPEKNVPLVLEAFEAMRAANPVLRLVLVGDGPQGDALKQRHAEYVFAGMRTGEDLARHYASADIFLFPSVTETFGNVTLEALASGLAVVAYNYAAAAQHIRDDRDGLLATLDDREEFKSKAVTLANNVHRVRQLGLAARAAARDIAWDRAFRQLERVLYGLLAQPAAAR
jgi:glycosyltransferase involved in cell wall biosynthesis